jgi:hypothetical protein
MPRLPAPPDANGLSAVSQCKGDTYIRALLAQEYRPGEDRQKSAAENSMRQVLSVRTGTRSQNYSGGTYRLPGSPIMHLMQLALGMMDEDGFDLRPIFEGADRDPGRW